MRRSAIILLLLTVCAGSFARSPRNGIQALSGRVEVSDGKARVSMRVEAGERAARGSRIVVFVPTITDGIHRLALPAIVVQGPRARIATLRHDWVGAAEALKPALDEGAILTANGSSMAYNASSDYLPWMEGARLVAEVLTVGCCSFMRGDDFPICEILLPKAEPLPVAAEAPAPVPVPEPAAEPTEPVENLLYIVLFRQGRAEIDPSLDENAVTLEDMVRSLDDIDGGVNIVVAGYASPEGSFAVNDRLSRRRAEAVKRYLLLHTGLSADDITAYTGAENWDGLREQVEKSDMPCRDEVLRIIDTVPIWDSAARRGRESELMKLGAGVPYKYMYRHFFPLLRNAAYIKIYIDK